MIAYSKIGHFGRLGNQLFQFASTYGIAKKAGLDVAFPLENTLEPVKEYFKDGIIRHVTFDVPKYFCFDNSLLKKREDIAVSYIFHEPHFHFSEAAFSVPDLCDIAGYYQTEKYFKHCESDIRRLLSFKEEIIAKCKSLYVKYVGNVYSNGNRVTSIHVRVGDYAGLQEFHPILETQYYQSAIEKLYEDTNVFLVFSDDIQYCKQFFPDHDKIKYIEDGTDIEQLCLMSMCDNNIIGNSTYSWWGAWLNSSPVTVIAPKKWFGPAYQRTHNTKDLYPENWIVI